MGASTSVLGILAAHSAFVSEESLATPVHLVDNGPGVILGEEARKCARFDLPPFTEPN